MTTPFAALETRMATALIGRLANVNAAFGPVSVPCVFDASAADIGSGPGPARNGRQWTLAAPADDFAGAGVKKGDLVNIQGADYELVSQDTDAGWTTWTVRKA